MPAQAIYRGKLYGMDRPKLGVDLSYRFDTEERTGPFGVSKTDTQVLSERIDLETEGWAYHPAMALFTLRLSPEWRQTAEQQGVGHERETDSALLGYGLDLTLLPYKPYTVNLYARKQSSVLTTSLAPVSESESEAYGANLMLKYRVLPTILSYAHSTMDQTGFIEARENRDELRLNMRHERKSNDTRFDFSNVTRDRVTTGVTTGATTHTENLYWNLSNDYRLTADNRVQLGSSLGYRESRSDVSTSTGLNLSETLNWRHTKRFSTHYNLQHSQDDNDGLSIDRNMLSAGLSHFLYENLTTTASVSGSNSSQGDSNYGGNLGLGYQRSIPWGTIFANIGQDYRVNKPGEGLIRTTETFLNLLNGDTALLVNQYVVEDAISVVDDLGSPMVEGFDYEIVPSGTSVRIRNLTGGPKTFVVTYDYQSPTYDSSTYGQTYGVGVHLWNTWRINYRYTHSKQDFLAGIPPDVLAEETRHTLDSDLRWRWSTTRFLYEDTDSASGLSMTRWRIEESVHFRPSPTRFVGASAYYGRATLKDTGAEDGFHGARGDLQWLLTANSRVKLEALYAVIDGTTVSTVDKGVAAQWEWTYGIWKADATYRYLNQEDQVSGQTRNRHTLFFSLRRALW